MGTPPSHRRATQELTMVSHPNNLRQHRSQTKRLASHRCHGHRDKSGWLGSYKDPGRHWQLRRHPIRFNLRQHEIRQKSSPSRTEHITFDVVDMLYNYNAIFGRGVINIFRAVLHPGYLCMKLPFARGVIAVYGNQDLARIAEETATLGQKNVHNLGK